LTAIGVGVTAFAFFEHANNFLILAPALYTLLAVAYLAKSAFTLVEKIKYAGGLSNTSLAVAGYPAQRWKDTVSDNGHTKAALANYFSKNPPSFGAAQGNRLGKKGGFGGGKTI